jgi:hypothetical protein
MWPRTDVKGVFGPCLAILVAGCASVAPIHPADVLASPAGFEGRNVTIRGYLRYGDDARGLWQSSAVLRKLDTLPGNAPEWNSCLTLWNADKFRKQFVELRESNVTLVGIVRTMPPLGSEEIALGRCSDTGLVIESIR